MAYRARGTSPPSRRYEESKVATGPVFSTGFDTRFSQQPKSHLDSLTTVRTGERIVDAQPISRRHYAASGHSAAQMKTEYAVRPRGNSSVGDDGRAPLRIIPPPSSPTQKRPVVNNFAHDRPRSPLSSRFYPAGETERFILPAVSTSRPSRYHGNATPIDQNRLAPLGRERREHSGYRFPASRAYLAGGALVRYDEDDYSYTTPREQFDRDYPPPPPRARRNSYVRKDLPVTTSNFDEWKTPLQTRRDQGPPPAMRQLDRIGDDEARHPHGRSGNYSDTEGDLDKPRRRHSLKIPVSLHQDRQQRDSTERDDHSDRRAAQHHSRTHEDEPSYSSDRENYRPSSHYERHQHQQRPKSQDKSLESPSRGHEVAATGLGGLATAGLAGALVKKARDKGEDSDHDDLRSMRGSRYGRDRDHVVGDPNRAREHLKEKPRDRAAELREEDALREHRRDKGRKERSDSDSVDDGQGHAQRHRRKHRHHRSDPRPQDLELDSTLDDRKVLDMHKDVDQDLHSLNSAQEDSDLQRRDRRHSHASQRLASDEMQLRPPVGSDQGDDQEERAARLQLVEPPKEKEPDLRPKGILKPARQIPFPEDPNPTREGVAPLKDAGKKGIPPGARWTKVNRMLVNPAALEAAHERYEERDDYVIVLRVLSREEIQKFADKTKEIREARELEWQEREPQRRRKARRSNSDVSSEEERSTPLAIEAPPASSIDPRSQQANPANRNTRPEADAITMAGLGIRT